MSDPNDDEPPPQVGAPLLPLDNPATREDARRPWPRGQGPVRTIALAIVVGISSIAIMVFALVQIFNSR